MVKNRSIGGSDMFGVDNDGQDIAKEVAWEDYESKWFNMPDQQGNKEWKRLNLEEWNSWGNKKKAV